jgi:hypothetical protein
MLRVTRNSFPGAHTDLNSPYRSASSSRPILFSFHFNKTLPNGLYSTTESARRAPAQFESPPTPQKDHIRSGNGPCNSFVSVLLFLLAPAPLPRFLPLITVLRSISQYHYCLAGYACAVINFRYGDTTSQLFLFNKIPWPLAHGAQLHCFIGDKTSSARGPRPPWRPVGHMMVVAYCTI